MSSSASASAYTCTQSITTDTNMNHFQHQSASASLEAMSGTSHIHTEYINVAHAHAQLFQTEKVYTLLKRYIEDWTNINNINISIQIEYWSKQNGHMRITVW